MNFSNPFLDAAGQCLPGANAAIDHTQAAYQQLSRQRAANAIAALGDQRRYATSSIQKLTDYAVAELGFTTEEVRKICQRALLEAYKNE